ncbi:hypothetical protein LguiB_031324 [Lonicera macranthoides]
MMQLQEIPNGVIYRTSSPLSTELLETGRDQVCCNSRNGFSELISLVFKSIETEFYRNTYLVFQNS